MENVTGYIKTHDNSICGDENAKYYWGNKKVTFKVFLNNIKKSRGFCYLSSGNYTGLAYQFRNHLLYHNGIVTNFLTSNESDIVNTITEYSILGYSNDNYEIINGSIEGNNLKLIVRIHSTIDISNKIIYVPKKWSSENIKEYVIKSVKEQIHDIEALEYYLQDVIKDKTGALHNRINALEDHNKKTDILTAIAFAGVIILSAILLFKFW